MFRKATTVLLLIFLGLYMPVAGTSVCRCLGPDAESCCAELSGCCDEGETGEDSCCGDPDCCVVLPVMPEGVEPQLSVVPASLSVPAQVVQTGDFLSLSSRVTVVTPAPICAPPPWSGASIRIATGVWRL